MSLRVDSSEDWLTRLAWWRVAWECGYYFWLGPLIMMINASGIHSHSGRVVDKELKNNPREKLRSCIFRSPSHFYAQKQHCVLSQFFLTPWLWSPSLSTSTRFCFVFIRRSLIRFFRKYFTSSSWSPKSMSGIFRWARAPHGGLPSQHPWAEESRKFKKRREALSRLSCRRLIGYITTLKYHQERKREGRFLCVREA